MSSALDEVPVKSAGQAKYISQSAFSRSRQFICATRGTLLDYWYSHTLRQGLFWTAYYSDFYRYHDSGAAMLKLINIDHLAFDPELPDDVREALGRLDFLDHLDGVLDLDSDAIIEIVESLYGIELLAVEGDPMFMPSDELVASIKDQVVEMLATRGVIGDAISEKIRELTRVSGDNIDVICGETGLSRWKVEWD